MLTERSEGAVAKHKVVVREVSYMIDQAFCACGWESDRFYDGAEYAHQQWKKHLQEVASS